MKSSVIIKSLKYTTILTGVVGTIGVVALPRYIHNRIHQKLEQSGFKISESDMEITTSGIFLKEVNITRDDISISSPKILIAPKMDGEYIIEILSGTIKISPKDNTQTQTNESKSNHIIKLQNINIEVTHPKYGAVQLTNVNGEKKKNSIYLEIANAKVNNKFGVFSLKSMIVKDNEVSIQDMESTIYELPKMELAKDISINDGKSKNISVYIRHAKSAYDLVSLSADEITYKQGILSGTHAILSHGDVGLILQKFEVSKQDAFKMKAAEISGNYPAISSAPIVIEDVTGEFKKDHDGFKAKLLISGFEIQIQANMNEKTFKLSIDKAQCSNILSSMPGSFKDKMNGFTYSGNLELQVDVDLKSPNVDVKLDNGCKSVTYPDVFSRQALRSAFKRVIIDKSGKELEETGGPETTGWIKYDEISKYIKYSIITREDPGFYSHKGIWIEAIKESMMDNIKAGKFVRGGSTISMQTAKNLWLNRSKTISRKIQEFFLTTHLESVLKKDEIFETYVNIIEFSPGEYGLEKAAKRYFNITQKDLSISQSVFMVTMLPNPKAVVWGKDGRVSKERMKIIQQVIEKMNKAGFISDEEKQSGLQEMVVIGKPITEKIDEADGKEINRDW